jgi:hypothetical protein
MSKMFAEIGRIVDEDISNRITQFDVIFEAITNAIHANATKITCIFNSSDTPIKTIENSTEIVKKKVDAITVIDNGDGMDDNNYDSFCKYRSEYKKKLGAKGVGRFVFLKVYDSVKYKSQLIAKQEERNFIFSREFDTNNLQKTLAKVDSNFTEISLHTLSKSYLNRDKHVDRRIELDLDLIRERVLLNLIPTLFFYKKRNISIVINFEDKTSSETKTINPSDIPDFTDEKFPIKDRGGKEFDFILNHKIENVQGKLHAFYCGNNRTVAEFADKDFKLSLPYGYSGFLLLESEYLNERVNNERNDFSIFPYKTDAFSTLSWEVINDNLKSIITEIVKLGIPETENINKQKITEIQEERPYLISYIEDSDIDIAGFMDKKQIIDKAKKRFDKAKEKVLDAAGKEEYTDAELIEAINLTQNELVSYINDRVQIIERLKSLIDKRERVEKIIHNLFMEKGSEADYFCVGKNNLWLLDDRFTTYSYAASDKRIKHILKQIGEEEGDTETPDDAPDLSLFFSQNPNEAEKLKSVLVEIKPFDSQSKSDRKKFAGIQQLVDYVKAFKNKEKIDEIFAFLVTDVDEKLANRLKNDDYTPLFSLDNPIFHRFYKELGISIYVISAKSIVSDAEARNKVFLDIIKKQSRLKNILQEDKKMGKDENKA